MHMQYFGEYTERTNNVIPAQEMTGVVKVHKIKDKYFPYFVSENGTIYDLPEFTVTYTNRNVAVIARVYSKTRNIKLPSGQITKTYNKLIIIRIKPIDILYNELEDITLD